jgi:hypothetical protein
MHKLSPKRSFYSITSSLRHYTDHNKNTANSVGSSYEHDVTTHEIMFACKNINTVIKY